MTLFSPPRPPAQHLGPAATKADVAELASPATPPSEALQETPVPGDVGLASPGEALNAGQAPQVGSTAAETKREDAP